MHSHEEEIVAAMKEKILADIERDLVHEREVIDGIKMRSLRRKIINTHSYES